MPGCTFRLTNMSSARLDFVREQLDKLRQPGWEGADQRAGSQSTPDTKPSTRCVTSGG